MTFCERLYKETKEYHMIIDNHPFTKLIKTNKKAGDMYINFNKICIYQIQKYILLKDLVLQKKLIMNFELPDIFITDNLSKLVIRCGKFTIEHAYMFYLGLFSGGSILKKYIGCDHHDFLTFENPKELSNKLKAYLNANVLNEKEFISEVKDSYKLIKLCFDDFYKTFNFQTLIVGAQKLELV